MKNLMESQLEEAKNQVNRIQEIPLDEIKNFTARIQQVRSAIHENPSEERVREIKKKLEEIAQIFQDSNIHYVVDGALNIPLYNGNFFRDHRDIDFGVFSEDIPKLAQILEQKGYALFRFPKDTDEKVKKDNILIHELVRPDKIDISRVPHDHIFFLKVKKNFEIDADNYECFDIHPIDRNENGDIVRLNGSVIPQKYYLTAPKYKTESGKELQLCHPVILAYNKLLQGRDHDLADVEYMLKEGILSSENIKEIDALLAQDEEKNWYEEKPKIKKARQWLLAYL